ncbi:hypothetical protein D3C87_2148400 [compost metagenome]
MGSAFCLSTVEAWQFGARVVALWAQRARIVERFIKVFSAQGQHLFETDAERQVDFAGGAGIAQA